MCDIEKNEEDKLVSAAKISHPANKAREYPNLRSLRTPMKTQNVQHIQFDIYGCIWYGCGSKYLDTWIVNGKFFLENVINSIPLNTDWLHGLCICRNYDDGNAIGNNFFDLTGVMTLDNDHEHRALSFLNMVKDKMCLQNETGATNSPGGKNYTEYCDLQFVKSHIKSITHTDPTGVCFGYDKDLIHPHMRAARSAIRYITRTDFSLLKEIIDLKPHYLQKWVTFFFDVVDRLKYSKFFEDIISIYRVEDFTTDYIDVIPPNFLDEIPEDSIVRCIFKTCICAARHDDEIKNKLANNGILTEKCPNITIRKPKLLDPDHTI